VRLALARLRHGPTLVADEVNYLLNARVLVGGTPGQLRLASFSHGGYSALIAPLVAIHASPRTVYGLVLVANAALAASLAPLLYLLVARVLQPPRRVAVWAAFAAAAYPSVTVFSQVALAENLLLPLTVVWLLLFAWLLDVRSVWSRTICAGAFGLCGAALYAVHGRMIVATALTVAALAVLALSRRLPPGAALVGIALAGLGLVGTHALDHFLVATNYGGRTASEIGFGISNLREASGVTAVARNLVGQTWYVIVASLGLLLTVAVVDGRMFVNRVRRGDLDGSALVILLLLAAGAGLLVVSALSFRTVSRPDILVYGRYVDVVMPPLVAMALVRLTRHDRQDRLGIALAVVAAATAAVVTLHAVIHPPREPNRWNVASLPFLTLQLGSISLIGAGLVTGAALLVATRLRRRAPLLLVPAVILAFAATTAVVEREPVLSADRGDYPRGWTSPGTAAHAGAIAYDTSAYDVIGLYVYQWFLPHDRFVLYSGAGIPHTPYVISSRSWPRRHPGAGARAVWRDPGRDQVLFRLPSGS
jgi:hypothetical protein